jgi:hypothetical protein
MLPTAKPLAWKQPKQTAWALNFDLPYRPDSLKLWFKTGPDFHRRYQLLSWRTGKNPYYFQHADGYLSSAENPAHISLLDVQEKQLVLVVDDGDSPPLTLEKAEALQNGLALLAYLEPRNAYLLQFGDSLLAAPEYDLAEARNRIQPKTIPLSLGDAEPMKAALARLEKHERSYRQWYLWGGISVLAGLLVWMAINLMGDMQKKGS